MIRRPPRSTRTDTLFPYTTPFRSPVSRLRLDQARGGETGKCEDDMALPTFTMRQLLEAGVHFGHHTRRWNPKLDQYIFGVRNNVQILDLRQTVPMLHRALEAVRDTTAKGGRVVCVGTKRLAAAMGGQDGG